MLPVAATIGQPCPRLLLVDAIDTGVSHLGGRRFGCGLLAGGHQSQTSTESGTHAQRAGFRLEN